MKAEPNRLIPLKPTKKLVEQCSSTFFVQAPTYRNFSLMSPPFLLFLIRVKRVFSFENNSGLMKCKQTIWLEQRKTNRMHL